MQNKEFGELITRLIQKENLTRRETRQAFTVLLSNNTTEMQQGALLAALTAKGETEQEVAGAWEAIYELDTTKVAIDTGTLVDNSGTGMDTFKTFNISTAASLIAAAGGIPMARHGARAITSICGTVDMAQALGVDVECPAVIVAQSVEKCGIGLFNGMSPHVHPMALGRILSQIHFGSTLNIAASLANPALPSIGIRGVYSRKMVKPVARVMREIGYKRAIVVHGSIDGSDRGMDEASICGTTFCAELTGDGNIHETQIDPKAFGLRGNNSAALAPEPDIETESRRFTALIGNRENSARKEAAILNAGLIFYAADKAATLEEGIQQAALLLEKGEAFNTLENWVAAQNTAPQEGLRQLHRLVQ